MPPSRSPASSIASPRSRRNRKSSGASSTAVLSASTDFAATAVERRDCDGVANAIGSSIPSSSGPRCSLESSGRELTPSASASRIPGIGSGGALRAGCASGSLRSAAGSTTGASVAGDAPSETSIDSARTGREGRAFSSENASATPACGRSASGIEVSATDGGAGSAGTDRTGESTGDGIDAPREPLGAGALGGVTTSPRSSSIDPSRGSASGGSWTSATATGVARLVAFSSSIAALSSASGSTSSAAYESSSSRSSSTMSRSSPRTCSGSSSTHSSAASPVASSSTSRLASRTSAGASSSRSSAPPPGSWSGVMMRAVPQPSSGPGTGASTGAREALDRSTEDRRASSTL